MTRFWMMLASFCFELLLRVLCFGGILTVAIALTLPELFWGYNAVAVVCGAAAVTIGLAGAVWAPPIRWRRY